MKNSLSLKLTSWLLSFLMILQSCSVKMPVSSIYSKDITTDERIQWPVIIDENESQLVRLTPLENIDNMLVFEVEATNKSQDSIRIDPQNWQLDYLSMAQAGTMKIDSTSYPLRGDQINQTYQNIAKKLTKARTGNTVLTIAGIVVVVVIVVAAVLISDDDDNDDDSDDEDDQVVTRLSRRKSSNRADHSSFTRSSSRIDRSRNRGSFNPSIHVSLGSSKTIQPKETQEWSVKEKIAYYKESGEFFKNANFEAFTVLKGETSVFQLYFPRREGSKNLKLKGRVGDHNYQWDFEHYVRGLQKIN